MAKLPNRLVIEITNTDKVDELGNPVIGFESKDYAECIIEELEKIKAEMEKAGSHFANNGDTLYGIQVAIHILNNHISEVKGENK